VQVDTLQADHPAAAVFAVLDLEVLRAADACLLRDQS
jgi:hypothetical protein